jgi:dTDP-4-dehydrorhamnose reductase
MNILLIGNNGQLGWELERTLQPLGSVAAVSRPQVDLAQIDDLRSLIRAKRPEVIINAAAYTAVDRAESEPELAYKINRDAPAGISEESEFCGALFVHYSTDYVFDGAQSTPYTESDLANPLSVYGQSKLAGEQAIQTSRGAYLILRTSWVYGLRRTSFVKKVLSWARSHYELKVVTDQVSGPTWCRDLAEATAQLLAMGGQQPAAWLGERRGLYHLASTGTASRFEWAQAILELDPNPHEQLARTLEPAVSQDFPTPARRPYYSALDCSRFYKAFGLRLPHWRTSLQLAMDKERLA